MQSCHTLLMTAWWCQVASRAAAVAQSAVNLKPGANNTDVLANLTSSAKAVSQVTVQVGTFLSFTGRVPSRPEHEIAIFLHECA